MPLLWNCDIAPEETGALLVAFLDDLSFWENHDTKTPITSNTSASYAMKVEKQCSRRFKQEQEDKKQLRQKQQKPQQSHPQQSNKTNSLTRTEKSTAEVEEKQRLTTNWRSTVDPASGRMYYYNIVTNATQWEKPEEIRAMERQRRKERRQRDMQFFVVMEENILASQARGELIPSIPLKETQRQGPPKEPLTSAFEPVRVRTISCMNEDLLSLIHNDPFRDFNEKPQAVVTKPFIFQRDTKKDKILNESLGFDKKSEPALPASCRPPLPEPSTNSLLKTELDDLELSPDARDLDTLRGEHLLDGFLDQDPVSGSDSSTISSASTSSSCSSPPPEEKTSTASVIGHVRRNTGNTIYVESTMDAPNVDATITCICGVYRAHIAQAAVTNKGRKRHRHGPPVSINTARVNLDVFLDSHDDVENYSSSLDVPSIEQIRRLFREFYDRSLMAHDTIIMTLIYVERLVKETNGALTPSPANWKSVLFSCMILASKVWDDLSMWNIDFSNVSAASGLSDYSLQRINQLERTVLTCLNFNVKVPASEYAKYYFLIRTMLIRSGKINKAVTPLKQEQMNLLEIKTKKYEQTKSFQQSKQQSRRVGSFDFSWLGGVQSKALGPVLNDQACLEQILATNR